MFHPTTQHLLSLFLALGSATQLAAQAEQTDLSDPEVAHVAVTANSIDIDLAKLAQTRASKKEIVQFATTMIKDHSAVNQQATALAARLGVTPKDNPASQSLMTGAATARQVIEKLSGKEFDRAYMDREIAFHQVVFNALDGVLIPTTSNAELRKLLTDAKSVVATHLEHAKQLRSAMGAVD
jgi:putative membrane protein